MDERRRHPRYSVHVVVGVARDGRTLDATMMNVSTGGAFLRVGERLAQGTRLDVTITRTDGDNVVLPALVCRVALNGVGVAWEPDGPDRDRTIADLVAGLSAGA